MVTNDQFRQFALSFPGTIELPHFERTSFRINKKIFVTLSEKDRIANFKLTPIDQSFFCSIDTEIVYPVQNKWGIQGWTSANLEMIDKELLLELLTSAFNVVNSK
ncbi:MmcQ/YjbR family DNA-binding protein [Dyadobacter sp. NIV53]|uniref:MmcQ/YjbR family DNA-binding protein n=1 Tax=Dyadobacter sp. NIV53 TaxID=2861765 RepID=UPI001C884869|nr:MmcQ/YjbR family DNA-binding protein [Dyadobacter sp. NIV53]